MLRCHSRQPPHAILLTVRGPSGPAVGGPRLWGPDACGPPKGGPGKLVIPSGLKDW